MGQLSSIRPNRFQVPSDLQRRSFIIICDFREVVVDTGNEIGRPRKSRWYKTSSKCAIIFRRPETQNNSQAQAIRLSHRSKYRH
jgi:hypothetical protein